MTSLVLCVDRDNDIGVKVRAKGPIVGWKKNLEVAQSLALIDPEDSDVNAIYGAVKIARSLDIEVATITGDSNVGVISDQKLTDQLDKLIKDLKPESVILVSDGAEDDQIIPVIQSRIKINSVKTIVVRQSKELEKAYFTVTNFLKEVTDDPNLARLLFAVPGVVFVLLMLGGLDAIRLIFGVVGVYMIIKGLGYEEEFFEGASNFIKSLSIGRISTLTYFFALIVFVVALGFGYSDLRSNPVDLSDPRSTLDSATVFILNTKSINLLVVTIVIIIVGRMIDDWVAKEKLQVRRYLILLAFFVLLNGVMMAGVKFWTEQYGLGDFMVSVFAGIILFGACIKLTGIFFMNEIRSHQKVIGNLAEKDVYTSSGEHLGRVSRVLFKAGELSGIRVGRKTVLKDEIASIDKVVVVKQ